MAKVELYKFRSLANDKDFGFAKDILENIQFWCSSFLELNDPMEGIFLSQRENIDVIFSEKNKYVICSFSKKKAFENPAMWGYYANAFKGMAIKIKVNTSDVKKMTYDNKPLEIAGDIFDSIQKILTTKLKSWEHEAEFRFLEKSKKGYHKIGEITGVYFGDPYCDVENKLKIEGYSDSLKDYAKRKAELIEIAKTKGIEVHTVKIAEDGKVQEVV